MRNAYKILVGYPEGKRLLGRSSRRWEDNIIMNLREIEWESMDWIHLRSVGDPCEHNYEASGCIKGGEFPY
jgi:hypothetical protein